MGATAEIGADGTSIQLTASAAAVGKGFKVLGSSYGRATWPMTVFFAHSLPVLPWYAALGTTVPWLPLDWKEDTIGTPTITWPYYVAGNVHDKGAAAGNHGEGSRAHGQKSKWMLHHV